MVSYDTIIIFLPILSTLILTVINILYFHDGKIKNKSERTFVKKYVRICLVWCTMWEQTRTLLFIRAASASHGCSLGSDAVVPPREDKRGVLKYQGAFAAYPRSTNWAAVFHSPLDISPSLFFRLIAEQPTSPYPDGLTESKSKHWTCLVQ